MPALSNADRRELAEINRRNLERDAADGISRDCESVPRFIIHEPQFLTDAAAEADAAKERIAGRVKALPGEGVECERKCTIHVRRLLDLDVDLVEGAEDMFVPVCCGNDRCAHCWRLRLVRSIHRAASCLLDDNEADTFAVVIQQPGNAEERTVYTTEKAARQVRRELHRQGQASRVERIRGRLRPRTKAVFVAETTWKEWRDYDKALRRQIRNAGRLRVRRGDDSVLVIAEKPFDGSRCVTPAEAAELAASAIEHLRRGKHSFRMLGSWTDHKPKKWELVAKLSVVLDSATVDRLVEGIGSCAKRLGALPAFVIRTASLSEAEAIAQQAESSILKSLAVLDEKVSIRRNFSPSGKTGAALALEDYLPDGFDPGGNPWPT